MIRYISVASLVILSTGVTLKPSLVESKRADA